MSLELPFAPEPRERPFTVREVVEGARAVLERALPPVWVEAEISNFKTYPSGHWYFTLKDPWAQLRCVMFRTDARRVPATPSDGLKVYARGELSVGVRRGELQLVVRQLLATTEGGFYAIVLERSRQALEKDGLLDPARKRVLPPLPRCVGVITSPEGAAWRDVVAVVQRRWPGVTLVLIGARVQGDDAPRELRRALALADRYAPLEVLIVGRGGGSKEDLWAFNDEQVARAVAAARVPTISAVGHEMDVTLTDLVADVRAPTPSAAAEKAVPDRRELARHLKALETRLGAAAERRVDLAAAGLRHAAGRMAALAGGRVALAHRLVGQAALRMSAACEARLAGRRRVLDRLGAALEALSPLKVLERGFAVALSDGGRVLRRTGDFAPGLAFRLRLADGAVRARVEAPPS